MFSGLLISLRRQIEAGPLTGYKFSLATGRRYRAGEFERERVEAIELLINLGDVVFDVGAHRGYVSLVAAKSAGCSGRVIALEPSSKNFRFLKLHARWNESWSDAWIEPKHVAVAEAPGTAWFGGGKSLTSSLQEGPSREQVRVTTLDQVSEDERVAPNFIKIDVEGAEARVLRGASKVLQEPNLAVLVATHTEALYKECKDILQAHGLRIIESDRVAQALLKGWDKVEDPELLALGPDRVVDPAAIAKFVAA